MSRFHGMFPVFHGGSRHGDVNSSIDGTNFKASFCTGNTWIGRRPDVKRPTRYFGRPMMGVRGEQSKTPS